MKFRHFALTIAILQQLICSSFASASPITWPLPAAINDTDVQIKFELDSTWHTVHGTCSGIEGRAWLDNKLDYRSVFIRVEIPVSKLDTGSSSRDEEMREVMAADEFPTISFSGHGIVGNCHPDMLVEGQPCDDMLKGRLRIRSTELEMPIKITITRVSQGIRVAGSLPINWAEYGVEDPSILIAHVDPIVTVNFTVLLRDAPIKEPR